MTNPGHSADLLEAAADLRRAARPFVLATVVRSIRPASARPGDRALLTADDSRGWVGGGCVQSTIEREARQALIDGRPRLIRLSPTPTAEEGIESYPMTCHSGGTLEIYLEPVLPPPRLVVLGESAVTEALAALAPSVGFRVSSDLAAAPDTWIVVAGMAGGEEAPVLGAALQAEVPYVALVASPKRAAALVDELRRAGLTETQLARLKAPAGLDIGAATPPEIALSILAEIVQRRRTRQSVGVVPAVGPQEPAHLYAVDPMCGMPVEIATARWTAVREGDTCYFCGPGCRAAFLAHAASP